MASTRVNAAVLLAMLAWFLHRASVIGVLASLAEAAGLADYYEQYLHRYAPLHAHLFSAPIDSWLDDRLNAALRVHNRTQ